MRKAKFPSLVGVLHLPALPGAPRARGPAPGLMRAIVKQVCAEAKTLEQEGFEAVILENFGDVPFFKSHVPPVTVSAMSVCAAALAASFRLPFGINVLRNDGASALAIAAVTGASFIRVNVLSGVVASDQGLIEGEAADLMRARETLRAQGTDVQVWGDVLVKHAVTLSTTDVKIATEEVALRAGADAVILTGSTTGRAVDLELLKCASNVEPGRLPKYLGSGVTPENIRSFGRYADGVIVGSALRRGGKAGAPLELARARRFSKAWHARRY